MTKWDIEPSLPQLIMLAPECSHCGNEVHVERDSAWCEHCRVAWDVIFDGNVSEPDPDYDDSPKVSCGVVPPETLTLVHGPCILPSEHAGEHLCPYSRTTKPKETP